MAVMEQEQKDRAMAFAYAYFESFNYKKAYMSVFGWKEDRAYLKYVNRPDVQEALEAVRQEFKNRRLANIEDVANELNAIAFSDIKDAVKKISADGMVELNDLDGYDTRFVQSISSGTVGDKFSTGPSIKSHDKIKALENLAKLYGNQNGDAAAAAEIFRIGYETRMKLSESNRNGKTVDEGLPPQ